VMIGRGAYGRPWWPGVLAEQLSSGSGFGLPTLAEERDLVLKHQALTISLYGEGLGNKTFRKHLGWTIDRLHERQLIDADTRTELRASLLGNKDNNLITSRITALYDQAASHSEKIAA
jgi:tRNA-dihydrouridine synthase B